MNTATLALFIGSAILAQVLGVALLGLYRQRGRYRDLVTGTALDFASAPRRTAITPAPTPTPTAPIPTRRPAPVAVTAPVTVCFSRSAKQVRWTPGSGSLLELAEAAGVPVAPGCRTGHCGCCETALESGEVEYAKPPAVRIESGHCLLCIGTAKGDVTLAL